MEQVLGIAAIGILLAMQLGLVLFVDVLRRSTNSFHKKAIAAGVFAPAMLICTAILALSAIALKPF